MNSDKKILGGYAKKGYKPKETDSCIYIWLGKSIIGSLPKNEATPEALQDICRRHREGLTEPKI